MTDGDALLRAVLFDPADDAPRLVYADWLDERGEADRAWLIRHQVGRARVPPAHGCRARCGCGRCRDHLRACRLVTDRGPEWLGPALAVVTAYQFGRGLPAAVTAAPDAFLARAADLFRAHPVTAVRLWGKWPLAQGAEFVWLADTSHLGRYRLGCDFAELSPGLWGVLTEGDDYSPRLLRRCYPTSEAADAALSRACVRYGRRAAGLPDLPADLLRP